MRQAMTTPLQFYAPPDLRAALEEGAARSAAKLSEYLRQALVEKLKRDGIALGSPALGSDNDNRDAAAAGKAA